MKSVNVENAGQSLLRMYSRDESSVIAIICYYYYYYLELGNM